MCVLCAGKDLRLQNVLFQEEHVHNPSQAESQVFQILLMLPAPLKPKTEVPKPISLDDANYFSYIFHSER